MPHPAPALPAQANRDALQPEARVSASPDGPLGLGLGVLGHLAHAPQGLVTYRRLAPVTHVVEGGARSVSGRCPGTTQGLNMFETRLLLL